MHVCASNDTYDPHDMQKCEFDTLIKKVQAILRGKEM